MLVSKSWPYRSPIAKLLRFFSASRDKWKAKCKTAKRENKSLKFCLAKMKESRDSWKAQARCLKKKFQIQTEPAVEGEAERRAKRENRRLKRCLAKMKESRDSWKVQAKCLKTKLQMQSVAVVNGGAAGHERNP